MARNQQIIKLQDNNRNLQYSYNYISGKYNRLIEAVNQLPAEEIKFINKIITATEPPERTQSHDMEL
jgi:hypothetical protein